MGFQPTRSGQSHRLRVVVGFHFEADELADQASHFTGQQMEVFRDEAFRWSVAPTIEESGS